MSFLKLQRVSADSISSNCLQGMRGIEIFFILKLRSLKEHVIRWEYLFYGRRNFGDFQSNFVILYGRYIILQQNKYRSVEFRVN